MIFFAFIFAFTIFIYIFATEIHKTLIIWVLNPLRQRAALWVMVPHWTKVQEPLPRPASDIYLSGSRQRMRSEIFDNLRWLSIDFDIPTAGNHTVKVVMIDPEIVVEKLVINPDNEHPSYHGKE